VGRSSEVLEVDFKNKAIFVKQFEGKASTYWRGGSGNIHSRILRKMRQVL
jgi:ATP-dependent Lhr-like helicase